MKIKKRYGKHGGYFSKIIGEETYTYSAEEAAEAESMNRLEIKEGQLIYNKTDRGFYLQYAIGGYCFTFLIILFSLYKETSLGIWTYLGFIIASSLFLLYYYTGPEQLFILDRKTGMFTFPYMFWAKAITMPFKDALFAYTMKNLAVAPVPPTLSVMHPNGFTSTDIGASYILEIWSLYVWYMDKNRPLPPGTAFDPYRQKDFERRKAEGFPRPLYPSRVPTPEATPEQQAERERIGGW